MDYVTLLGTEAVESAGHRIRSAADSMAQSVGYLDEALRMHHQRMEELVQRVEEVMADLGERT